jgi:prepilin-type N-terminal cleavage/methylation domain-containing protein
MTRHTPQHRPAGAAGFTMIEVLVAALVLGIGLVGIIGMQTTAAIANQRASDLRVGADLAETVLERLKRDALEWTDVEASFSSDSWLGAGLTDDSLGAWQLPGATADGSGEAEAPVFNDLGIPSNGGPVASGSEYYREKNSRYCVQYRLTWVIQNELARADVRVLWPSRAAGERLLGGSCAALDDAATIAPADYDQFFEWVRVTGMIRRNGGGQVVGPT